MDRVSFQVSRASRVASTALQLTEMTANALDDLVRPGKEDELRGVHQRMMTVDDIVATMMDQTLQVRASHEEQHADILSSAEEIRTTVEQLVDEKDSVDREIIRLSAEEDRLEREPMLKHVRLAVSTCIEDYLALKGVIHAQFLATDAYLVETIDNLAKWSEEMDALDEALEEIGAAALVVEDTIRKLEKSEAEVVARRECASLALDA